MTEQSEAPLGSSKKIYDIADDMDTTPHDVEDDEGSVQLKKEDVEAAETLLKLHRGSTFGQSYDNGSVQLKKEDVEAAETLLKLHRDSTFALRRLVNRHDGKVDRAVTTLLHHASQHPLGSARTAEAVARDERHRAKKDRLDAALTLIKLSGQSRAASKAALTLLRLRHDCDAFLHHEKQKQIPLAPSAIDERNAAEHFLALKKFRKQYPAVLRTSSREDGRVFSMSDDPSVLA